MGVGSGGARTVTKAVLSLSFLFHTGIDYLMQLPLPKLLEIAKEANELGGKK